MTRKFWLTLWLLAFIVPASAQYFRMHFDHLSVTEGLSQSSVRSITQDKHGFMWFATLDGLDKFDGYEIITYYAGHQDGELPDNVINCVYTTNDDAEQLWIGTADHGICLYDPVFDKFVNFSQQKNPQTLVNDHITVIYGNSNTLWIGTENGLSKFTQKTNKWQNFTTENSPLLNDFITCLLFDNDDKLWIGTKQGIYVLDTALNKFNTILAIDDLVEMQITAMSRDIYGNIWIGTSLGILYYNNQTKQVSFNQIFANPIYISALKVDFENILWIGTKTQGLYRYDPSSENLTNFIHDATDPNSLSVNSILTFYEDKKHLLWIGTSLGGVDKWNRAAQNLLVFRHNPYNANSLSSSRVRNIFEDKNGTIWIGTVDGGLNKWDKKNQKFISTKHNPKDKKSIPENHVRVIFQDSKNRYWVGTANSGLCIINPQTLKVKKLFVHHNDDSTSIPSNSIWRIVEDKNQNIWIATYGGGLCKLEDDKNYHFKSFQHKKNDSTSLSNDFCTTVFVDSKNRIWVGTIDGLNMYNPENQSFTIFRNDIEDTSSLSNNRIYSILEDHAGNIWIGTKGGLNKYLENEKFKQFTVDNYDLPNNVIMGILEDSQNNLWLTTNRGLCKFNPQTYEARTYDVKDGLQSNEFLVGSFYKTADGMFIVGGINGFNAFYPEKIKPNPNLPSVVITDFMISNKRVKTDTNIAEKKYLFLNHKQNDLTFKFVAIDYILPEKNQYAYMLEGYDKDWVYCKYQRYAKYTNLPPGKYVFHVKGSNNDLVWNEEGTSIVIYIKPALWQTLGFKIGVVLFVLFSILFAAWLRMRILKKQKRILEEEVARQTKEIREQKEEIEAQNAVLQQQKEEIETQRDEIEEQRKIAVAQRDIIAQHKKDIEDSIIYAKNIQTAALPTNKFLQILFEEFFILFRPRDIVSGDFYWASQKNGKIIAVAADCTGHGVPGAFMSMLGISFLNKIVNEKGIIEADKILNRMRNNVIHALNQTVDGVSKDGMDIALCVIDPEKQIIEFAGANNPLYFVRNNELTEYKAQKMPIAIYDDMKPFRKISIEYTKNDIIYLFSDGFADQFGGPKGKKFKYANLKKLLVKISEKPMQEQKNHLNETIERWMAYPDKYANGANHTQIDDIIIFGIRL